MKRRASADDFNRVDDFIDNCVPAGEAEDFPDLKAARKAWARILLTYGNAPKCEVKRKK